jgi:toxin HigB-1
MIESFAHKGLKKLFEEDERRKVPAGLADKIARILARLNEAVKVQDMGLPGYRLHPLKGDLAGFWAVSVSGNWRVTFRFENGMARDVDLIDYH